MPRSSGLGFGARELRPCRAAPQVRDERVNLFQKDSVAILRTPAGHCRSSSRSGGYGLLTLLTGRQGRLLPCHQPSPAPAPGSPAAPAWARQLQQEELEASATI